MGGVDPTPRDLNMFTSTKAERKGFRRAQQLLLCLMKINAEVLLSNHCSAYVRLNGFYRVIYLRTMGKVWCVGVFCFVF